jgi:hypothetical protein
MASLISGPGITNSTLYHSRLCSNGERKEQGPRKFVERAMSMKKSRCRTECSGETPLHILLQPSMHLTRPAADPWPDPHGYR